MKKKTWIIVLIILIAFIAVPFIYMKIAMNDLAHKNGTVTTKQIKQ